MHNKKQYIYCKGRFSNGLKECEHGFFHIGLWGDKELIEHEKLEQAKDTKNDWHIGFDIDRKFEKFKDSVVQVKKDNEEIS
jgi:hypothetical protein